MTGLSFDDVAKGAGARVIKIAVRAPNMNVIVLRPEDLFGVARGLSGDRRITGVDRDLGRLIKAIDGSVELAGPGLGPPVTTRLRA
jgi:hypothetical protein